MKKLIVAITVGALTGFLMSSNASLVGYWDASNPGASPSTQWDDLSGTGHHLGLVDNGNGGPAHNAGGYYTLGNTDGFIGTANGDFDFDNSAGGSSADPYTFNVYMNWAGANSGDVPYSIMTKADRPQVAGAHYTGHTFDLNWSQPDTLQLAQQTGNNTDRLVQRRGDPGTASLAGRDVMLTVTHDGTGTGAGTTFYANGVELTRGSFDQSSLNGTTLNSGALTVGHNDDSGGIGQTNNGFNGDLYFVEIYNTALSGQEVLGRFNVIPEPTSLALLGIGGGLLWWRRRR